jgi:hypothetical protein
MTRKWNLSLTYEPKIQPVINGKIRQTIRAVGKAGKKKEGDLISLHGWKGKPYRSSWSWRTKYTPITEIKNCSISERGIDDLYFQGETGFWDWDELDRLAEMDGIMPPTGKTLKEVLVGKNNLSCDWVECQIIRW